MKYKATIFDLGGTLVRSASWSDYAEAVRKMATMLNAPAEDFVKLWFDKGEGLGTGVFANYQDLIKHVCGLLDVNVEDHQVESTASIPFNITKQMIMVPRDDALHVLTHLKLNGYKIGLISDCGPDVPEIWNDTPFANLIDVAIFSCYVGMNKADMRIFQLAAAELAVKPEHCIYIADGNRQELANAAKLGMRAIRIVIPEEIDENPLREKWHGQVISSLTEVMQIIG